MKKDFYLTMALICLCLNEIYYRVQYKTFYMIYGNYEEFRDTTIFMISSHIGNVFPYIAIVFVSMKINNLSLRVMFIIFGSIVFILDALGTFNIFNWNNFFFSV